MLTALLAPLLLIAPGLKLLLDVMSLVPVLWLLSGFMSLEEVDAAALDEGAAPGAGLPEAEARPRDAVAPAGGGDGGLGRGGEQKKTGAASAPDQAPPARGNKGKKRKMGEAPRVDGGGRATGGGQLQAGDKGQKRAARDAEVAESRGAGGGDDTEARHQLGPDPAATAHAAAEEDDPDSPWAPLRLHPALRRALRVLGFREPTPIQRACIPAAAHQGRVRLLACTLAAPLACTACWMQCWHVGQALPVHYGALENLCWS